MKRFFGAIALLCVMLALAACSRMPDPTITVDNYCSGINNSGGEFAKMLSEEEEYQKIIDTYPDLKLDFENFIFAYIGTFEYEIDTEKTVTDKEAGTAEVYVTLQYADMEEVKVLAAAELLDWYTNVDYFPETEETTAKSLQIMADILENGNCGKMSEEVVVKLTYNRETKEWEIDNKKDITEGFIA